MAGYAGDLRDGLAHLEQSRHAFVAQIMEVQIFDTEHLACSGEGRADCVGGVGEYLRCHTRHRLDDCQRLGYKIAEYVIAYLIARILHVAHEHAPGGGVEICPGNAGDLFLPACAEYCEGDDLLHRRRKWPVPVYRAEMLHEPIDLVNRRSAIALVAFLREAELLCDHHSILHRLLAQWIAPCRARDRKYRAEMAEIILNRLWLDQQGLGEGDQVGAADFAAAAVGDVETLLVQPQ